MTRWQILVMLTLMLGAPLLLNGNMPPYAQLPAAHGANEPGDGPQPAPGGDDSVSKIAAELKQVVQMGILAWFCWFVTSKAGPKMMHDFREETKAQRDTNSGEMKAEREFNRATLDKIAGEYRTQYTEVVKLFADRDRQVHDDLVQLGTTMNATVRHCAETTAKRAVQ